MTTYTSWIRDDDLLDLLEGEDWVNPETLTILGGDTDEE